MILLESIHKVREENYSDHSHRKRQLTKNIIKYSKLNQIEKKTLYSQILAIRGVYSPLY